MAGEKHLVRHWRGSRESYNFLKSINRLDPWTRYSVIDSGLTGSEISEYFGENEISKPTGQLLPVSAIVENAPLEENARPYDRYLVGSDGFGYEIVEFQPKATSGGTVLVKVTHEFDYKYGVRVRAEGLKNYVYVDGVLKSYDDVDCGAF